MLDLGAGQWFEVRQEVHSKIKTTCSVIPLAPNASYPLVALFGFEGQHDHMLESSTILGRALHRSRIQ